MSHLSLSFLSQKGVLWLFQDGLCSFSYCPHNSHDNNHVHISLSLSLFGVKLNFCNKLMYSTVVTVLDVLFYILVRRGFTVVQQIHWSMLYIRQISQLRSSGTCQIILVQLSRLEWIKFFYLQMFKLILTRLKPRLILLLVPLLAEQWRIQKTCMISWILCNEEL